MNLSALMNDGAADEDQKKRSPETQRTSQPPLSAGAAGHHRTPSYGLPSHAQTPLFPPPPASSVRPQSQGLTPLQTPSQAPGGQYPFPQPYSAITPGGRPPSHGYQFPQLSPFQHHPASISPTPSSHHSQTPHSARQISIDNLIESPNDFKRPSPQLHRTSPPYPNQAVRERSMSVSPKTVPMPALQGMGHLKRPAEESVAAQPPAKSRRTSSSRPDAMSAGVACSPAARPVKEGVEVPSDSAKPNALAENGLPKRRTIRPPWAVLSKHNPRFKQQQQPNGHANTSNGDSSAPWQQNPPLDMDLIKASRILGRWEKTMNWNTPYPDMLRVVQDWFYTQLTDLANVGTDPREGTIEIEAKIGTLLRADTEERVTNLPVASMTVIRPDANRQYKFQSQMTLPEHKAMNDAFNSAVRASHQPGRVQMSYEHLRNTDSLYALSRLGLQAIPQSLHRHLKREPRFRITTDTKTGHTKARIIKVNIAHLHIYNPSFNYDCRISVNYEVNLDRPGLDPNSLFADDPGSNKYPVPVEIPRIKDRMAYKHLAYSFDLTKVEMEGLNPIYEMELEVDSNLLRQQMNLMTQGVAENAFGDVVSGFLDNATFLMRQKPTMATSL